MVQGSGFRVQESVGSRVQGVGFSVYSAGVDAILWRSQSHLWGGRGQGPGFSVHSEEVRVQGVGCGV